MINASDLCRIYFAGKRGLLGQDSAPEVQALLDFQKIAVERLLHMITEYRGAILADSVGLGKTHIASAVLLARARNGDRAAVIVPATLRAKWRAHLSGFDELRQVPVASNASLHRLQPRVPFTFLVIDEAHSFRNPGTKRYGELLRLTSAARVLLVTATPINNSLLDLAALLELFLPSDAFARFGVPDLDRLFRDARRQPDVVPVLRSTIERVIVRRSRSVATPVASGDSELRLPVTHSPIAVPYELGARGSLQWVLDSIMSLELLAFSSGREGAAHEHGLILLKMFLVRRLESSIPGFTASVLRLQAFLREHLEQLRQGRLLRPRDRFKFDDSAQLGLDSLVAVAMPRHIDAKPFETAAVNDLAQLESALQCVHIMDSRTKLDACLRALTSHLGQARAVVFTEFVETADLLQRELDRRGLSSACVTGATARVGSNSCRREDVFSLFSAASGAPDEAAPKVLVCTDVLAEGVDLHGANVVVSYDLPWNPVRLMQRVGRVSRLGSPYREVHSLQLIPQQAIEDFIGVMRILRQKVAVIDRTIELDVPVLAGGLGVAEEDFLIESAARVEDRADGLGEQLELMQQPLHFSVGVGPLRHRFVVFGADRQLQAFEVCGRTLAPVGVRGEQTLAGIVERGDCGTWRLLHPTLRDALLTLPAFAAPAPLSPRLTRILSRTSQLHAFLDTPELRILDEVRRRLSRVSRRQGERMIEAAAVGFDRDPRSWTVAALCSFLKRLAAQLTAVPDVAEGLRAGGRLVAVLDVCDVEQFDSGGN